MFYQETLQAGENPSEINVSGTLFHRKPNEDDNGEYPRHLHLYFEMVFLYNIVRPYGKFVLDQNVFEPQEDVLILIPPLSVHGFTGVRAQDSLQVQFTDEFLHKNAFSYSKKQMLRLSGEMQRNGYMKIEKESALRRIIDDMIRIVPRFVTPMRHEDHVIHYDIPYELSLNAITLQLVCELLRTGNLAAVDGSLYEKNSGSLYNVMNRIIDHPEEKLSMEKAAEMACMNYYSFSRFFLQIIGYSYVDFCNHMRVHRAQELLADPNLSSTEIAERLNFGSTSYFNRIFRKFSQCSPSEYRNRLFRE